MISSLALERSRPESGERKLAPSPGLAHFALRLLSMRLFLLSIAASLLLRQATILPSTRNRIPPQRPHPIIGDLNYAEDPRVSMA